MSVRVLLVALLSWASYAYAQSAADLELCVGPSRTVDERIAACTRALAPGKLPAMDQARAYRARAEHWSDKRQHKRALADLNEAIRLHPQYALAYVHRGSTYSALGDPDRAIADYSEALRLNPRDEVAYNNRGNAWSEKRNLDRAIADYGEAIRLNPGDVPAHHNRAVAWLGKNNPGRALADFNQTLKLDPDNSTRLNHLAWLLATSNVDALRDGKRAVTLAHRACELTAWNQFNYIDTLAAAHAAAGNFKEAVQWQQKALQDAKIAKDAGAHKRLALYQAGKAYRE